jgi:hypothetical protein
VKPTTPSQPEPTLKPAAARKQGKAPASRIEGKAAQPSVEAPQQAPMKKKAVTGKSTPPPKKPIPASIPPPNQSPIEISDLLDNLPVNACVELTRRLLTAVPTLPSGAARWLTCRGCLLLTALWSRGTGGAQWVGRWASSVRGGQAVRTIRLGLPPSRGGLQTFPGGRWWRAPGPGGDGMTLGNRHARRLGLAARSGLRRLLGCKGLPQLSQEGWVTLHR